MKYMCMSVLLLFSSINLVADHNCNDSTNPNEEIETCDINYESGNFYVKKEQQYFMKAVKSIEEAKEQLVQLVNTYHLCKMAAPGKLIITYESGFYYVKRNGYYFSKNFANLEEAVTMKSTILNVFAD